MGMFICGMAAQGCSRCIDTIVLVLVVVLVLDRGEARHTLLAFARQKQPILHYSDTPYSVLPFSPPIEDEDDDEYEDEHNGTT